MSATQHAAVFLFGTLEGFWFYRSGVLMPSAVGLQMVFRSFVILKLFLSAVGSSMLVQCLLSVVQPAQFEDTRHFSESAKGYYRQIIGSLILGVGMAMAGSGPTLLPGQLVALAPGVVLAVGAIAGAALFSVLDKPMFHTDCAPVMIRNTLDHHAKSSYAAIAAPVGTLLVAGALATEFFFPQRRDLVGAPFATANGDLSWLFHPIAAGIVVGLNQIPLRCIAGIGQGGSYSVMVLSNLLTGGRVAKNAALDGSIEGAGQLVYVWGGTAAGALAAYVTSGPALTTLYRGIPWPTSASSAAPLFLGSALMVFGARVAKGCTCGHGITGFSELSLHSIVAAACIFAGGIGYAGLTATA